MSNRCLVVDKTTQRRFVCFFFLKGRKRNISSESFFAKTVIVYDTCGVESI